MDVFVPSLTLANGSSKTQIPFLVFVIFLVKDINDINHGSSDVVSNWKASSSTGLTLTDLLWQMNYLCNVSQLANVSKLAGTARENLHHLLKI